MRNLILLAACSLSLGASALSVTITVMQHAVCTNDLGALQANVSGGVPPYQYEWSNGGTLPDQLQLPAGSYWVIVTDAVLEDDTAYATVNTLSAYPPRPLAMSPYCNGDEPNGVFYYTGDPQYGGYFGPLPYNFDWVSPITNILNAGELCRSYTYARFWFNALPWESFTLDYNDASGCPGTLEVTIMPPVQLPTIQVMDVQGSCSNGANGAITVSIAQEPNFNGMRLELKDGLGAYVTDPCFNAVYVGTSPITHTFEELEAGDYTLLLETEWYTPQYSACRDSIVVNVPDLGPTCGNVSGHLFVDGNGDCTYQGGENEVPGTVLEFLPGPYYANTDVNGEYSINLPMDTYTITEQSSVIDQSCPAAVTLDALNGIQTVNVACDALIPLDVQLAMASGAARPGFQLHYSIDLDNLTPANTGVVTLTFQFDPAVSLISTWPPASSVAGNTITWTGPNLTMTSAFAHRDIDVTLQVPPDVGLIGTDLSANATLATTNTDVDLSNNSSSHVVTVTGSVDPNDKLVRTSSGLSDSQYFLVQDSSLTYTVRFQNTGTDTAFTVVIVDTLAAELDPATLRIGAGSHTFTWSLQGQGVLKFFFANILLPDSGDSEPLSHGFVSFTVRPDAGLLPGTLISNAADIYFDYNPPVHTNDASVVVETSTTAPSITLEVGACCHALTTGDALLVFAVAGPFAATRTELLGMDGRVMRSWGPRSIAREGSALSLAGMGQGCYLLRLLGTDGRAWSFRFVR